MKASRGLTLLLFSFLLSSSFARPLSIATTQVATNTTAAVLPTTTMASLVPLAFSKSPMPPSSASFSCRSTLLTGLAGGFFFGVVAAVALLMFCRKKKGQRERKLSPPSQTSTASAPQSYGMRIFTFGEVQKLTDSFSSKQLIGEGGFAKVYKADLSTGEKVAVKHLTKAGRQQFETEVENLSRAHHKHVVSLVGYCKAKNERILVYEYVPNNTLDFYLHGDGQGKLNWPDRLKIALGSAKGLAYLHEYCHPQIIHRDIKASNILLEVDFEAKIADFGLVKCISKSKSHVTTNVKGTYGYIDPKYGQSGQLTTKSDIYSFGMLLLELITGRKPSDIIESREGLFNWVTYKLEICEKDPNFKTLADKELWEQKLPEIDRVGKLAMACVAQKAKNRPKISKIVRDLEDIVQAVEDGPIRKARRGAGHVAFAVEGKARPAKPAKKRGS